MSTPSKYRFRRTVSKYETYLAICVRLRFLIREASIKKRRDDKATKKDAAKTKKDDKAKEIKGKRSNRAIKRIARLAKNVLREKRRSLTIVWYATDYGIDNMAKRVLLKKRLE